MQFVASRKGFESVVPAGAIESSQVLTEGVFVGLCSNMLAFAKTSMSRASSTSPVSASMIARGAEGMPAGMRGTTA
jgi:hypothetical protein